MILRYVDWKVKRAGFEGFHKRAHLVYWGAFIGGGIYWSRVFIKYFYELSGRLLKRAFIR